MTKHEQACSNMKTWEPTTNTKRTAHHGTAGHGQTTTLHARKVTATLGKNKLHKRDGLVDWLRQFYTAAKRPRGREHVLTVFLCLPLL